MDELYLDNIDEYVNDHNKIVTYKWLSLTLGVHVNIAKQMLFHYLDHKRKESSAQLHATYLVSGKFVDNGQTSHKVSVVKEDQLEDVKSKMSLIVSVHVYSIQKALLKDSGPLYAVDYDAVKDNLKNCSTYSAIRCADAVPMSSAELQQGREINHTPPPEPEHKKSGMNGETNGTSKSSSKPQKGIMGMFANKTAPKSTNSDKDIKPEQKEEAPVDATKSKAAAKANPMMNFFGSQAAKKPEKTVKEEEAEPQRQTSQPQEKQETAAVEPTKDTKKDSRSKTKRLVDSDSEEEKMEKKRRRRIKKPVPDSSDEDGEVLTSFVLFKSASSDMKIRKRRRVLKARTFVDEEGCIVTEKAYESESYSETEDDFQATKQAPKDPFPAKPAASKKQEEKKSQKKTSASANKGGKQASIMGFFQKK
uniref:DNA polymerase delta subunit 3 n=1 Tax=Sparus aurata TaxID=8175 RepID=A0A671VZW2_SPAAU